MNPRTDIRKLCDKRRKMKEDGKFDEYDFLFGKDSTLLLAVIEYLALTYEQSQKNLEQLRKKLKKLKMT